MMASPTIESTIGGFTTGADPLSIDTGFTIGADDAFSIGGAPSPPSRTIKKTGAINKTGTINKSGARRKTKTKHPTTTLTTLCPSLVPPTPLHNVVLTSDAPDDLALPDDLLPIIFEHTLMQPLAQFVLEGDWLLVSGDWLQQLQSLSQVCRAGRDAVRHLCATIEGTSKLCVGSLTPWTSRGWDPKYYWLWQLASHRREHNEYYAKLKTFKRTVADPDGGRKREAAVVRALATPWTRYM